MRFISAFVIGLLAIAESSVAHGAELRCNTPGVAQLVVPHLLAEDPSAKKLGLEVADVSLLSVTDEGVCLVKVSTKQGHSFRYRFRYGAGDAALEMVP
jgi:hypothetical protein